jgi:polyribonucleotide nucleotidyltransferase
MIGASAALHISDIPFEGPVAAVRLASINGEFIVNPTFAQIDESQLDIVISGTENGITMVEGGGAEVSEETMLEAIDFAHKTIKELCQLQDKLRELAGKPKIEVKAVEKEFPQREDLRAWAFPKMEEACFVKGKMERMKAIRAIITEAEEKYAEELADEDKPLLYAEFEEIETEIVRKSIFEKKVRTDGRGPTDIRDINCEINVLARTHGSALFTRGETQSLGVTTLGTVYDEKILDDIDGDVRKSFMLHYNFPPFSVGETGRLATKRREIGHGHLAERALEKMLPEKDDFPYTIRLVSEILESNGSSSMATVCSGTMALLHAGVPLKKSVAGIAMGLVTQGDDFVVLSDILGEEDHLGDMDFKVAGTSEGITAFQMDIKIQGVSREILAKALEQAKAGRLHILNIMNGTIAQPREDLSDFAPKIISFMINPDKIGAIIGSGGKTIKSISEMFDSTVNIENDGKVIIYCKNKTGAADAKAYIDKLLEEPVIGKIYKGKVMRIEDYGAFIEFLPGKEGLCHISKLAHTRVNATRDVVTEEQEIYVKIVDIDNLKRVNLSHIDAVKEDGTMAEEGVVNRRFSSDKDSSSFRGRDRDRGPRDRDRGPRDRDRGPRDRDRGPRDRDRGPRDRDRGPRDRDRDRDRDQNRRR